MNNIFRNRVQKGIATLSQKAFQGFPDAVEVEQAGKELQKVIALRFGRSFHIRQVDTGSCGACLSEILAACNPLYDIQRFGVDFVASPRHADALLVTGPVSKNMEHALRSTYEAMPAPKLVITCGDCALDGGMFNGSYYTLGGAGSVLAAHAHIKGCPPKPREIIQALLTFLRVV